MEFELDIKLHHYWQIYLNNLYFSTLTVSSIGFGSGDFPITEVRRHIFFIMFQIGGILSFSVIITGLNQFIEEITSNETENSGTPEIDYLMSQILFNSCDQHDHEKNTDVLEDVYIWNTMVDRPIQNDLFNHKIYQQIQDSAIGKSIDDCVIHE